MKEARFTMGCSRAAAGITVTLTLLVFAAAGTGRANATKVRFTWADHPGDPTRGLPPGDYTHL